MSVQTFINRCFRKIGAYGAGETPGSDESNDALSDLNDLLAEWYDQGIEIDSGSLSLTDTFPIDGADSKAVMYNLCKVLLNEYPNPRVGQNIVDEANQSYNKIQAKYLEIETSKLDETLTYSPNGYNILIDS
jgi:hypothetical protein